VEEDRRTRKNRETLAGKPPLTESPHHQPHQLLFRNPIFLPVPALPHMFLTVIADRASDLREKLSDL